MSLVQKYKNTFWFTLIETLLWVLIFSIVIVAGFSALSSVMAWKIKLIEKTAIQKEAFYFSEKLFEMIKTWWTIDYEEYWNRFSYDTTYWSGHYINPTGFWNYGNTWVIWTNTYGNQPYLCRSWNTYPITIASQGYTGCLVSNNTVWVSQANTLQRYSQYALQFIDYNSDADSNLWDEDIPTDWNIVWDDDDLYLGQWPDGFPEWTNVWELYLINGSWNERVFFRLNTSVDPNAPSWSVCTWTQIMTWEWCLGTIEFLRLIGEDAWYDHANTGWSSDNDGFIDTWLIDPDFSWWTRVVAWSNNNNYWQPLFPDTIHVKDVQFFPYPNKDLQYSWRDTNNSVNISPYVRISLTLTPSWKSRKKIRGEIPEIEINTTVQLTDIFN